MGLQIRHIKYLQKNNGNKSCMDEKRQYICIRFKKGC